MAWTAPRTWVAGETVTAALLNTHLRDNLKAAGDSWTAYTPALTASVTNPTLGTGSTAVGGYIAVGKLVIGQARITFGTSGVAAGSGNYRLSLPVAVARTSRPLIATCVLQDVSASAILLPIANPVSSTLVEFNYPATWPSGTNTAVTHVAPWAWDVSDYLDIEFVYEAA